MPLLHQDNGRNAGGSQEKRRSIPDFWSLNFDASQLSEAAASTNRTNESFNEWRWEAPKSPEAASSPLSLVPSSSFPPRQPSTFVSYSEVARPGGSGSSGSSGGSDARREVELVTSLKTLATPSAQFGRGNSQHTRLGCELLLDSFWPPEGARSHARQDCQRTLPRRASFCGDATSTSGSYAQDGSVLRWSGVLPTRGLDPSSGFSAKVFLGGLPWDITEHLLVQALRQFHPVRVEWPGRDSSLAPRGFAYVTLHCERRVRALLDAARRRGSDWYYRISSKSLRNKEVQVIPWAVSDSNWVYQDGGVRNGASSLRLEPARTVFVGALHGMLSASALASIMNDLFSGVVYAGIDTDKNKYPIGSGRVTFNNVRSYVRAVSAGYVEIRTDKFTKKIQVDPYLEDTMCSMCNVHQGPYFCRDPACFQYFCRSCWASQHSTLSHTPLMRNSRSVQLSGAGQLQPQLEADVFNGFALPNDAGIPSPPEPGAALALEWQ